MNAYSKAFNKRLRDMKNNNPKDYWRLLCCKDKRGIEKIQTTVLTEFFKKLNIDQHVYEESDINDQSNNVHINENMFINMDFTD